MATNGPTPLAITLDRDDDRPLGVQISDQVRRLVATGTLPVGTRLPSSRRLAADLGVSRSVTEQAWEQLLAEGWVATRRGAGTFVDTGRIAAGRRPRRRPPPRPDRQLVDLGAGTPWIDPRHRPLWRRAWREVSAAAPPRGYDDPRGLPELRERLADRLARTRGVTVTPDQVRVTAGTTAGLRHIIAALPAGAIAMEDPGYRAAAVTAAEYGRRLLDLPAATPADALTSPTLADETVAAAYVTPAHQHPLGHVMPADQRRRLLAWARDHDAVVIEDDFDSEFRYDVAPVPALAALDPSVVACLGTASKSVLPTLRLGWMVLPEWLREPIDRARARTHDTAAWPVQRAFVSLLRDGYVDAVVRTARQVYAARAPRVVAALSPYATLAAPVAGMYATWLLPRATALRVHAAAAEAGFGIGLLSDYCRTATTTGIVLGFGGPTDAELDRALDVITSTLVDRGRRRAPGQGRVR